MQFRRMRTVFGTGRQQWSAKYCWYSNNLSHGHRNPQIQMLWSFVQMGIKHFTDWSASLVKWKLKLRLRTITSVPWASGVGCHKLVSYRNFTAFKISYWSSQRTLITIYRRDMLISRKDDKNGYRLQVQREKVKMDGWDPAHPLWLPSPIRMLVHTCYTKLNGDILFALTETDLWVRPV